MGDDEMTSGWMRATSPSGDHRYEGVVHWAGELGYGVRAPERGQSAVDAADPVESPHAPPADTTGDGH